MDIGDVMDDIGSGLDTITGLRVFPYGVDTVTPPAAVVWLPEIDYDASMGRGVDRLTLEVFVVVDRAQPRAARDLVGQYGAGSGPASVKEAIESFDATAYDSARVERVIFGGVDIGATSYLGATFTVDIIGNGA